MSIRVHGDENILPGGFIIDDEFSLLGPPPAAKVWAVRVIFMTCVSGPTIAIVHRKIGRTPADIMYLQLDFSEVQSNFQTDTVDVRPPGGFVLDADNESIVLIALSAGADDVHVVMTWVESD